MRTIFLNLFLLLSITSFVNGATNESLPLTSDVGARPIAMGGAFTGVADGPETAFYNISGAAFFETYQFSATLYKQTTGDSANDITNTMVSIFMPMKQLDGVVGISLIYENMGTNEGTTSSGDPTGEFTTYNMVLGLNYSTKLSDTIGIGLGAKYIYSHLYTDFIGKSFAFDASATYINDHKFNKDTNARFTAGLGLQNIGSKMSYQDEDQADDLPLFLRSGCSYKVDLNKMESTILLALEIDKDLFAGLEFSDNFTYRIATEYAYKNMIFARCGYSIDADIYGNYNWFNWGFGIKQYNITIDFARDSNTFDGLFENKNIFSIGYSF